jgi:hypothetical protein
MASVVEYGSYIIDLSIAMLENPQGLTQSQAQHLRVIHQKAVDFLTGYLQHESSSLPNLLGYLQNGAIQPLQIIIGSSDKILSGDCGRVHKTYGEAVVEIRDCGYAMYDEVESMYDNLRNLMGNLGMTG